MNVLLNPLRDPGDPPWLIWGKKASVIEMDTKGTDESRVNPLDRDVNTAFIASEPALHTSTIERSKYRAILHRMDQASINTGSFAAWDTQ